MLNKTPKISIVFPVFNEENTLEILYQQTKEACIQSGVEYEMVFVDDGSSDGSLDMMKRLRAQDKKVIYVSLSRNFGHQNAIFAGMTYATGDAVITMDADLQHPPSLILKMVDLWRNGAEVVYTTKKDYSLPLPKLFAIKAFYWVISKISNIHLYFGQSDFRLLDRRVLKVILDMPGYHKFLRGQVSWVGFRQQGLTYNVEKRHSGKSKLSYRSRFLFALDGILAFSRYPLHLAMLLGIAVAAFSIIYMGYVLLVWAIKTLNIPFFSYVAPPGWFTLAVSIFFLGSIQLIAISIVGEYVGRTFDEIKGRPVFIVRETSAQK